jgi:hypothetical protein
MSIAEVVRKINEEPFRREMRNRITQESHGLSLFDEITLTRVMNGDKTYADKPKSLSISQVSEIAKGFIPFRNRLSEEVGKDFAKDSFAVMLYTTQTIIKEDLLVSPERIKAASQIYFALAEQFDDIFDTETSKSVSEAYLEVGKKTGKCSDDLFKQGLELLTTTNVDNKYLEVLKSSCKNYLSIEQQLRGMAAPHTTNPARELRRVIILKNQCFGDLAVALVEAVTNKELTSKNEASLRAAIALTTVMDSRKDRKIDNGKTASIAQLAINYESSALLNGNGRRHDGSQTMKQLEDYFSYNIGNPSLAFALKLGFNVALVKERIDQVF